MENIFEKTKSVNLSPQKKQAIQAELLQFMKNNPPQERKQSFTPFNIFTFNKAPSVVLAAVVLCFLAGGIASVKADSSLPGEWLYPIKVGVNEKIKEALAFSPKDKLEVNIQLAQTRLKEAEQLTVSGNTDATAQAQLTDNFNSHNKEVSDTILAADATSGTGDNPTTSADFEATLLAHQHILGQLKPQGNDAAMVAKLLATINATTSLLSNARAKANNKTDATAKLDISAKNKNLQEKILDLESSVATIKKLVKDKKDTLGASAVMQSEKNITAIQQKIDQEKSNIAANSADYQSSVFALQEADIMAKESRELINAKSNLHANVSIDIKSSHGENTAATINASNTENVNNYESPKVENPTK